MPIRKSVFRVLLLCLLPLTGAAGEGVPREYAWVGAHLSQYWPYHEEIGPAFIEESTLPGARAGYRLPFDISIQGQWERNEQRFGRNNRRIEVTNGWVSVRRHFGAASLEPYAGINLGELVFTTSEPNDETMLGVEAGMQKRIQPHWILDVGARVPHSLDNERFDLQAWIGLNHIFAIQGDD